MLWALGLRVSLRPWGHRQPVAGRFLALPAERHDQGEYFDITQFVSLNIEFFDFLQMAFLYQDLECLLGKEDNIDKIPINTRCMLFDMCRDGSDLSTRQTVASAYMASLALGGLLSTPRERLDRLNDPNNLVFGAALVKRPQ